MTAPYAYTAGARREICVFPTLKKLIQYVQSNYTAWNATTGLWNDFCALSYDEEADRESSDRVDIAAFTKHRDMPAEELAQVEKELDEAINASRLAYSKEVALYAPGKMPRFSGQGYLFEYPREDLLKREITRRTLQWEEIV